MESTTKALWLRTGDRFRFPHLKVSYHVNRVETLSPTRIKVYIIGGRTPCYVLDVNKPIVKIKPD